MRSNRKVIACAILFFSFNLSSVAIPSSAVHKAISEKTEDKGYELRSAEDVIRKNGFAVELTEDLQVFEPYLHAKHAVFITTDSAFYTFYHLLDRSFQFFEMQNIMQLSKFVNAMHQSLAKLHDNCAPKRVLAGRTVFTFCFHGRASLFYIAHQN